MRNSLIWRRGRDSNPRGAAKPPTDFESDLSSFHPWSRQPIRYAHRVDYSTNLSEGCFKQFQYMPLFTDTKVSVKVSVGMLLWP